MNKRIEAAAKVLCQRTAEACNTNADDEWSIHGEIYIEDAKAMLDAADKHDAWPGVMQDLLENTEQAPESSCSCHISPPCSDCSTWGSLRYVRATAEDMIKNRGVAS